METEQIERQFQLLNRFMYLVLGSSITLVPIGLGNILNGYRWDGFENYMGGIWPWIQVLATAPGFILLFGKNWRTLPFTYRQNTIFGYFLASWLSFLSFGLITASNASIETGFLILISALLIVVAYIWALRRNSSPRDEIFP